VTWIEKESWMVFMKTEETGVDQFFGLPKIGWLQFKKFKF
jgi:hypothetical protein